MKVSIIITVLDSHEVVKRQLLYLNNMPLPDDVEVILVDDGSKPVIEVPDVEFPLILHKTNNYEPWTEHIARHVGVLISSGEYLVCVDIDHIITKDLLEAVINTNCDVMKFRRRFGILNKYGQLKKDRATVIEYGAIADRVNRRGTKISPPGNCYMIRKDLYYSVVDNGKRFWHSLRKMEEQGRLTMCKTDDRPLIYAFPIGRYCGDTDADSLNLFHRLSRKMNAYKEAEKYAGAR